MTAAPSHPAPMRAPEPVRLEGTYVVLEPLSLDHLPALCEVGCDPELWRLTVNSAETPDQMRAYVETALAEHTRRVSLPFATVERATGRVVGSTRFGNIDVANRRMEIGWTWIGRPWQRTAVNTEAKLLMLRHAFETLGCMRVELKTDVLNERSRAAILRLGATQEGIFRKHQLTWTGRVRDSVWFSIVDDEWPEVRARLESLVASR